MEYPIVITDSAGRATGATTNYTLDLSFGESGNVFALVCDDIPLDKGYTVSIDGTEYGGIINSVKTTSKAGHAVSVWSGRTWHGILANHVLVPVPGRDYIQESGDANEVIANLLARMKLDSVFTAKKMRSGIQVAKFKFKRFSDGYSGMLAMLAAYAARLMIRKDDKTLYISAEPVSKYDKEQGEKLLDFTAERTWFPVNHLICAGEGELSEREVLHLYADESGNVSKTQTLFGVREVAELYDYKSADRVKLEEDGRKKLKEYQKRGKIELTVREEGQEMFIGDIVASTARAGSESSHVITSISKKIVKASGGVLSVRYEAEGRTYGKN